MGLNCEPSPEFYFVASPLHFLPAVGNVAVAFCTEDQNYYRARILNHEHDQAVVQFIDSGEQCIVGLDYLRPLPSNLHGGAVKV